MATNHPVYRLPFIKHQLLFGCHVSLCTEHSFQRQQWCSNLLCIRSFLVCFVNQAVRYFQLVAKHPAFFETHKQPLAASKRQQPDDKLRLSVATTWWQTQVVSLPSSIFIRSMWNTGNTVQLKNCTQKTYQECDLYNVQRLKRNVKMYKI